MEYGPVLLCTVLRLPGTQFNAEKHKGTILPLISTLFPSAMFGKIILSFWGNKKKSTEKRN